EYELGSWNEWHLMLNDRTSGWLSDAQDEYAVSFAAPGRKLPEAVQCKVGQSFVGDNQRYEITTLTTAHYRGVQGELPFQYWDKQNVTFWDLRPQTARFASIDYSDEPPALYLGEMVEFESLALKNLRAFEGWS